MVEIPNARHEEAKETWNAHVLAHDCKCADAHGWRSAETKKPINRSGCEDVRSHGGRKPRATRSRKPAVLPAKRARRPARKPIRKAPNDLVLSLAEEEG